MGTSVIAEVTSIVAAPASIAAAAVAAAAVAAVGLPHCLSSTCCWGAPLGPLLLLLKGRLLEKRPVSAAPGAAAIHRQK